MKQHLLERLRCPQTGQMLLLDSDDLSTKVGGHIASAEPFRVPNNEITNGWLVSKDGLHRYPIRDGIPRFVPSSNTTLLD